ELQRIEIVKIGDPRQRKTYNLLSAGLASLAKPERILGRQLPRAIEERQHAKAAPAGALRDYLVAIIEQRRVAAEFVDDEACDGGCILGIDHGLDPDDLRDHPAAL